MSKRITTKPRLKAKALCKDRCLWHSLGAQGANLHRPCTLVRPGRKKKNGQKPLGGPGEKDTHTVYKNEFVGQDMRQVVKKENDRPRERRVPNTAGNSRQRRPLTTVRVRCIGDKESDIQIIHSACFGR